jgi:hypothetical protein
MHIAIWVLAAIGLALWTLAAWGIASLFGMDLSWSGDLRALLDQIPFVAAIDPWLPGWRELVLVMLELTRTLLGWAGGAGAVVVWIVWGLGAAVIVGGAALVSVAVALIRRGSRPPPPAAAV